jgi:hypothetical protein
MESNHFDFKKKEHLILTIDENVVLHLKQLENSYCVLYFKNKEEKEEEEDEYSNIIIPQDVVVYDTVYNDKYSSSHPIKSRKYYYLSWSENYLVKYKSEIVLNMHNPRIWELDIHPSIPKPI